MRLRPAKLLIVLIVFANLILFYYTWKSFIWKTVLDSSSILAQPESISPITEKLKGNKDKIVKTNKHLRKSITIVFRNIYNFENDLKSSIDSILEVVPNIPIIVVQDSLPYPPIFYENNVSASECPVKFITLAFDINKTSRDLSPLLAVKTKYVLFLPDSIRINNKNLLQKILKDINSLTVKNNNNNNNVGDIKKSKDNNHIEDGTADGGVGGGSNVIDDNKKENNILDAAERKMIIIPFAGNLKSFSSCTQITLNFQNWTIEYNAVNTSEHCDLYLQKHAILMDVDILREMPDALSAPFPEMFYIQAKMLNIKKKIFPHSFQDGKRLFTSYHNKQRRMEIRKKQFREMYKKLQIKRIVKKSYKVSLRTDVKDNTNPTHNLILDSQFSSSNFSFPPSTETDLIGCEKTTKSCIFPVYNRKPFYLYLNKHTPPCCLDKLKSVFYHVLDELENVGIRYWLDNEALKSAIETNQLSPDAFDIDISFIAFDLDRSTPMKKSQLRPFSDSDGYYWIKATDGQYYRVQYSKINQIGLNLLPFEISGNRVKPTQFYGWKAKEFSAEFLHPMSTVNFLGKNVMCPNNVREYLEHKNIN